MTIKLYKNNSPANYVSKTLTNEESLSGTMRTPTSVTDPVIMLQRSSPVGFNYFYIPDFNRYYFLKSSVATAANLVTIEGHVDVLMTYSDRIRAANAIIFRQENDWNLYLDDGIFKTYQNPKHKLIKFPNRIEDFSYILALAGNNQTSI